MVQVKEKSLSAGTERDCVQKNTYVNQGSTAERK
jgi:hypothetical protein